MSGSEIRPQAEGAAQPQRRGLVPVVYCLSNRQATLRRGRRQSRVVLVPE